MLIFSVYDIRMTYSFCYASFSNLCQFYPFLCQYYLTKNWHKSEKKINTTYAQSRKLYKTYSFFTLSSQKIKSMQRIVNQQITVIVNFKKTTQNSYLKLSKVFHLAILLEKKIEIKTVYFLQITNLQNAELSATISNKSKLL